MLEKILIFGVGIALSASCSSLAPDPAVDPCEPICDSLADAGSALEDGAANLLDAGTEDPADGGSSPDAGMADAGEAVPDAGMADAGEVLCGPDVAEIEGDLADNDCDGTIDELEVCTNAAYQTIGAAITAAQSGDTIEVCAGTYPETLSTSKELHIRGAGVGQTILDAQQLGRALAISNTPGSGVSLEQFTVKNGLSAGNGGAIFCANGGVKLQMVEVLDSDAVNGGGLFASACEVTLTSATFAGNAASQSGGGAYTSNSSGSIASSEFRSNAARMGGGLAVIDGMMPIDLSAFSLNRAGLQGGGLYYRSNATISNSQFDDNEAGWTGGGIYLHQLAPTLSNVEVRDNISENDGGGIYLHQSNGEILNSTFSGNFSNDDGGGIRIFEGNMLVENNLIENNEAADSGGGVRISHLPSVFRNNQILNNHATGVGGGMDLDNCASQVIGGTIEGNTSYGSGGGIHAWLFPWFGGAIENVRIANNQAWQGGGIYLQHNFQSVRLSGLEVVGNTASRGAGIVVRTSDFSLENSVFAGNQASAEGGALAIGLDGSSYDEVEDMCPCPPTSTTGEIRFVVAYDNQASDGGSGLWIDAPGVAVHSSILASNAGSAVFVQGESPTWRYNNVIPASFVGMAAPSTDGNISATPEFADPAAGDFQLATSSQCVDVGSPAYLDLDGTPADMGRFGGLGGTL